MGSAPQARPSDRVLAARIAGQAGLVTRRQLLDVGWSPDAIKWRTASGRWLQVHRGVYLTTPGRRDWEVRVVAALLTVGAPSCLTGTSAGQAWGLATRSDDDDLPLPAVEVLVPLGRSGHDLPGVRVRRSRQFSTRMHPTAWPPRTTAPHTALDLALGHGPDRAIALLAKVCQLRLATEPELGAALRGRPTQPHRRILAEAIGLVGEGAESAAEVRYVRDVELAHGLPTGIRQLSAPGSRSRDFSYLEVRVVVEIDGRLGHVGWTGQQRRTSGTARLRPMGCSPCEAAGPTWPSRLVRSRPTLPRSSATGAGRAGRVAAGSVAWSPQASPDGRQPCVVGGAGTRRTAHDPATTGVPDRPARQSTRSRAMSTIGEEWVRPPTEMKSTPVSA